MEQPQEIVRRSTSVANAPAGTDDVHVISATLWPTGAEAADSTPDGEHIEVSLLPPSRRLVRPLPAAGLVGPYLRHLEQRILRRPRDLEAHVRRILTIDALDEGEGIAGALADLYIVLGRQGHSLRSRMLRIVEPRLNPELRDFFRENLEPGLSPTDPMPSLPHSRLSKQVTGTTRIVASSDPELANGDDDVEERLLEGMLDADPGNPEVCDALLDLLERDDNAEHFFRIYTRFLGRRLGRAERWRRMAAGFRRARDPAMADAETELPDLNSLR